MVVPLAACEAQCMLLALPFPAQLAWKAELLSARGTPPAWCTSSRMICNQAWEM